MMGIYIGIGFILAIVAQLIYRKILKEKHNTRLENERMILGLVEESKDVIYHFLVKPELKFLYISPSLEIYLGKGAIREAFENSYAPFDRIHPDDLNTVNKKINDELDYDKPLIQRWKDNDGNYRWFEEFATPIYENGELVAVQGIMRNIDEKVEIQQNLEYRINHDGLTGIYNREFFETNFIKLNEEESTSAAIILCDLDELKYYNDHFGHKKGDSLLIAAANLLNQFSSNTIKVTRIGGDEFVLLVRDKTEREIDQLVKDIVKELERYNDIPDNINIKMSIGAAYCANSTGQMTKLFTCADKRMYEDKLRKKSIGEFLPVH
ncbi:MAG: sensor domain-containing diguanylate cyclase [Heyndrickxia sp.]